MLNFSAEFVIETDACDEGVGAVLMQGGRPIAYMSKALSERRKLMSVYEKENVGYSISNTEMETLLVGKAFQGQD